MKPTTEAGRALVEDAERWCVRGQPDVGAEVTTPVLAIEQEAVTRVLDALAGAIHRLGSHEGRFESCGGYGCLPERIEDYDAVLALIEQHRPKGGPG